MLTCVALVVTSGKPALADGPVYRLEDPSTVTKLRVVIDKSETIRLDRPFAEALVGNDVVADVVPLTDQSIYVLGKKIGATRLSILDADKRLLGIVEIEVSYDVEGLRAHILQSLPTAQVTVKSMNGRIVLTGSVPDAVALEKVVSIAQQFAPDAVTNALGVASPQQVMLEVRFVEASRRAVRDLGVNWEIFSNVPGNFAMVTNFPSIIGSNAFPSSNTPFGAMLARLFSQGATADVIIQALEKRGVARRLAEPNLTALSGDTASFLAGGEFPFPVAQREDTITIEWKKFGIGLAFTPTVLSNGLINLKIEPEVSEIDPQNTLDIRGIVIPGLRVRRANTTIELRDGQSFSIAGLLDADNRKQQKQLPWIGQVPILGTLFRSASYEKKETDLVIIVTPRLVRPATPGQRLVTPLDDPRSGNDPDFFLMGHQEISKARRERRKARRLGKLTHGHILQTFGRPRRKVPGAPAYTSSIRRDVSPEPAAAEITGSIRRPNARFETDTNGGA